MPSFVVSLYSANASKKAAEKQAKAQEEAQRKQQVADERAAREAKARTPKQMHEREYAKGSTNANLRGVQATMLASRKAQNSEAGGKTKLGE